MKKLFLALIFFASLARAQTLTMTNTLSYTQGFASVQATVTGVPTWTNGNWTVNFGLLSTNLPGWVFNTNTVQVSLHVTANAIVTISNSEVSANNGNVTNSASQLYFAAQSNAVNSALQKLINYTIGK